MVSRSLPPPTASRIEALSDFLNWAGKLWPLLTILDEAPTRIARIFSADVASIYVLEGDGTTLVMRGNVGFPASALGRVRLAVGEGLTGDAVARLQPIATVAAENQRKFRSFEALAEARFPVFLAVPLLARGAPLGALVVQRRSVPFAPADVELLFSLGALVASGIQRAELLDARREERANRRPENARAAGGGTRKVILPGQPIVEGVALGAVAAPRRPSQRTVPPGAPDPLAAARALARAFEHATKDIDALRERSKELSLGEEARFLDDYAQILQDARFRERALSLVSKGKGIGPALGEVAGLAARTAHGFLQDAFSERRAKAIEDLCDALVMLARTDKRAELPSKAVLVADALTVFDLLVSARSSPVGVALSDVAEDPMSATLLALLGVPAIGNIGGLFRWATEGDVCLVDATHGLLVLNPSKSEIARLRAKRRAKALD
jgi:phosphotransferase system enzyme I (PtsP)